MFALDNQPQLDMLAMELYSDWREILVVKV